MPNKPTIQIAVFENASKTESLQIFETLPYKSIPKK